MDVIEGSPLSEIVKELLTHPKTAGTDMKPKPTRTSCGPRHDTTLVQVQGGERNYQVHHISRNLNSICRGHPGVGYAILQTSRSCPFHYIHSVHPRRGRRQQSRRRDLLCSVGAISAGTLKIKLEAAGYRFGDYLWVDCATNLLHTPKLRGLLRSGKVGMTRKTEAWNTPVESRCSNGHHLDARFNR